MPLYQTPTRASTTRSNIFVTQIRNIYRIVNKRSKLYSARLFYLHGVQVKLSKTGSHNRSLESWNSWTLTVFWVKRFAHKFDCHPRLSCFDSYHSHVSVNHHQSVIEIIDASWNLTRSQSASCSIFISAFSKANGVPCKIDKRSHPSK